MKPLQSILGLLVAATFSITAKANDAIVVLTEGAEAGQWTMDFDAAKAMAAEKELPLLLNFTGSDWCGWCKIMDENVFAKDDWKAFAAENVLLVTLDFPRDKTIVPEHFVERNNTLKDQFGVRGYPTYIILDSDGETKVGQLGAGRDKTPESFIAEFNAAVRLSPSNVEAFKKANPDQAEAYQAAIQAIEDARKALTDWLETRPERNDENTKKFGELQEAITAAEAELANF